MLCPVVAGRDEKRLHPSLFRQFLTSTLLQRGLRQNMCGLLQTPAISIWLRVVDPASPEETLNGSVFKAGRQHIAPVRKHLLI